MYLDYVLFGIGGALLMAAAVLGGMLLHSRKRSQDYRRTLKEDRERIDVVSTLRSTQSLEAASYPTDGTECLNADAPNVEETELLPEYQQTEPLFPHDGNKTAPIIPSYQATESLVKGNLRLGDLDVSPLNGKYELLKEIHGGGMSRIFLARHVKLGNEWIIKYVDGRHAELANEAEVLKKLNHISLPQIIDIFQNKQGLFLVERYIEGYSLENVLKLGRQIKEGQICEWGIQLSQVLTYLHNLESPIIHCDLKPSNIMLTHDDRLVLIDFGISKRQGITDRALGITLQYAAPEQFQGKARESQAVKERFGSLPPEQSDWEIDERTDLFSVGVILYELLTGELPTDKTVQNIRKYATPQMAEVVVKCLRIDPNERFQSASELTEALKKVKNQRVDIARKLTMRRVAAVCCAAALIGGVGSTASAVYINRTENLSMIDMDPGKALVTEQQSVQVLLQKVKPNGEIVTLEPDKVQWSYSDGNIARLDGDRLVGLNVGTTTLYGKYRNKVISLEVTVTEPIEELVDIALRYDDTVEMSIFAGGGEREHEDGSIETCRFVSPEYMSFSDGVLYISDSGLIRCVEGGNVSSIPIDPDFLTADKVCGYKNDLYAVTGPWESDNASYYGILRIADDGAEFLYYTEAARSSISDFAFSSDGSLWFVQQNLGTGQTGLCRLDMDSYESVWKTDLPDGASRMAFDEADNLYISVPTDGLILRVDAGTDTWRYFAGVEGEKNFIDGAIPNFYRPTALAIRENELFVLDFDTVRKITIEGEGALYTETVAGVPEADTNPAIKLGSGSEARLVASELASIAFNADGQLLLSDPKNSVVYTIVEE